MRIGFVLSLMPGMPFVSGIASAHAVFYVGTGSDCTHATIQQAIDAADNANGTTFVRITRTLTHTRQQLAIHGRNVVLTGGYANCQQIVDDGVHATLGRIDGAVHPLILVDGTTDSIGLYKLDITGNTNAHCASFPDAGAGRAIGVSGGPHRLVEVRDSSINGATADFGGGVHVRNDVSQERADVVVLLGANVTIANNMARIDGGVWCSNATVMMTRPGSTISVNVNLRADPLLAGPSAQDFRLQLASPAVEYVPMNDDPAAGHSNRVVDLESVPDEFDPQDAGAHERQRACGDDSIVCDGFAL